MALEKRMKNVADFKIQRARLSAEKFGVDAFLLSLPENIYSFTGFTSLNSLNTSSNEVYLIVNPATGRKGVVFGGVEAPMCIQDAHAELFPYGGFRYFLDDDVTLEFERLVKDVTDKAAPTLYEALKNAINTIAGGCKKIGVDDSKMPISTYKMLCEQFAQVEFIHDVKMTQHIMSVKHPEEIVDLKRAVNIAEEALQVMLQNLYMGITEHEMRLILASEMAKRDANPYFMTVTADKRGAYAVQFAKKNSVLKNGSVLRLDWGCIYKTMRSDIGRTVIVGENKEAEKYYSAILAGKRAVIDAMAPGVKLSDLFNLGVETVRSSGIPDYKRHHIGHSTGIEMYAHPLISADNDYPLEENMCFCVETPFYRLGHWGMQVEDCVAVGSEGVINLNNLHDEIFYVSL